jgi:hypothetical protein
MTVNAVADNALYTLYTPILPCKSDKHLWLRDRVETEVNGYNSVIRTCSHCQCSEIIWSKKAKLEGVILGPSFNGRTTEWHSVNGGSTPPGSTEEYTSA